MTERLEEHRDSGVEKNLAPVRIFNFRHSKAMYGPYDEKLGSEKPTGSINPEEQPLMDLTPEGIVHAEQEAKKFLNRLNPADDTLFVVSSDEVRALQTAHIYIKEALGLGFKVEKHERTGTDIARKIGEGYVRSLDSLSLHDSDMFEDTVFNPHHLMPGIGHINWDVISLELKEKWEQARAMILADDKGSWGANFFAHAKAVSAIFPHVRTPEKLHERQYQNLLRLAEFAKKKASSVGRINVLSFGHESYMGYALEQDTGHHALAK